VLDGAWPRDLEPIVMGIPSCKDEDPKKLAHLFEVKVGAGMLMATTFKFGSPYCKSQFDYFFLDEVLKYLLGDDCAPKASVTADFIRSFEDRQPDLLDFKLRGVNDVAMPPRATPKPKPGQETSDWRNMPPLPEEFEYMLKRRDHLDV